MNLAEDMHTYVNVDMYVQKVFEFFEIFTPGQMSQGCM